jgi:hypothetical protein
VSIGHRVAPAAVYGWFSEGFDKPDLETAPVAELT